MSNHPDADTNRGRLIAVSAHSGTGKTTLCARLRENHPEWIFSISCTTRPRRSTEQDGVDYTFLSDRDFIDFIENGKFAEWEWVHGYRYGTLKKTLEIALNQGHTLLLDVDVNGALRIKEKYPGDTVSIFVEPPDMATLVKRLKSRATENDSAIEKRLARIPDEQKLKNKFDHVVVNDALKEAVDEIETILKEKHDKPVRDPVIPGDS